MRKNKIVAFFGPDKHHDFLLECVLEVDKLAMALAFLITLQGAIQPRNFDTLVANI